jgi:hypothetical protein
VNGIRLEQILKRESAFLGAQIASWFRSNREERIARGAAFVVLNLRDERRNQIKGLMDVRELIEQFHHSVVVFEGVQTYPGETVLSGDQIFVERLMLVPKQNDTQNRHRWLNPDYNGIFSSLACECWSP